MYFFILVLIFLIFYFLNLSYTYKGRDPNVTVMDIFGIIFSDPDMNRRAGNLVADLFYHFLLGMASRV